MSVGVPVRLANGVGNFPDADKWMTDYDYLTALIHGNFTLSGGMEDWTAATTFTNPANAAVVADNWTVLKSGTTGATADVTREASVIDIVGTYSMKVNITCAGSADSIWDIHQALASPTRFRTETVLFGGRIWCATANKLRVKISDGVTTSYSTYHTGNSQWQTLNSLLAISGSAASVTISVEANPSDFTGAFYIDSLFTYVVPSQITATARASLAYLQLFSSFLAAAGGTMAGNIALNGNKVSGSGPATANGDLLRYEQALRLVGGTMSGAIAMGAQKITGIGAATASGDVPQIDQLPYANILDNGGFEIWQRGTSFTSPADATYQADRWMFNKNGTPTLVISKETTVVDTGLSSLKFSVTTASAGIKGYFSQSVENFASYRGRTVTASVRVKCNTANMVRLVVNDGVNASSWSSFHTGGNAWETLTVTYAVGSTATALLVLVGAVGSGDLQVSLSYFGPIMLNLGPVAVPFVPTNPQVDLARCQRFFQVIGGEVSPAYLGVCKVETTTIAFLTIYFLVKMRAAPTATVNNPTNFKCDQANGTQSAVTTITANGTMPSGVTILCTVSSGLVAGNASYLYANNLNATIFCSADL